MAASWSAQIYEKIKLLPIYEKIKWGGAVRGVGGGGEEGSISI